MFLGLLSIESICVFARQIVFMGWSVVQSRFAFFTLAAASPYSIGFYSFCFFSPGLLELYHIPTIAYSWSGLFIIGGIGGAAACAVTGNLYLLILLVLLPAAVITIYVNPVEDILLDRNTNTFLRKTAWCCSRFRDQVKFNLDRIVDATLEEGAGNRYRLVMRVRPDPLAELASPHDEVMPLSENFNAGLKGSLERLELVRVFLGMQAGPTNDFSNIMGSG